MSVSWCHFQRAHYSTVCSAKSRRIRLIV